MRGRPRSIGVVLALGLGYVAIYLCRKNLAVAIPLLEAKGIDRGQLGRVASIGTITYALGKLLLSPWIDRAGGRRGFLVALIAVAIFGALGGLAPSIALLTVAYGLNRFFGAGGWPSMMKLVPTWFRPAHVATVAAALSLSYVLGGAAATFLARAIAKHGGDWRAVMALPSIAPAVLAIACVFIVRAGPRASAPPSSDSPSSDSPSSDSPSSDLSTDSSSARPRGWAAIAELLARPRFLLVCILSFVLTLLRESFNVWSVDFLMTMQNRSLATAALQSTAFDLAGGLSIVLMGVAYDRVPRAWRRWLLAFVLAPLPLLLASLPRAAAMNAGLAALMVAAIGLLVYGPYSLLAGTLAVESGGAELAASASGIIDAVGYAASVLSGEALGRVVQRYGYRVGFFGMAALAGVAVVCASRLDADES